MAPRGRAGRTRPVAPLIALLLVLGLLAGPARAAAPTSAPTLAVSPTTVSSSRPTLSWNAVAGATQYRVYRNGTAIGWTTSRAVIDGGLARRSSATGTYVYTVRGADSAGALGPASNAVSYLYDLTPPATMGQVRATTPTNQSPALAWTASTAADVASYRVYRGTTTIATVPASQLAYVDRAALAGTYSYSVAAVDAAGNIGSRGTSLSVVYDTTAPARPTGLAGATPTNVAPALTWSRVLDGTVYVPRYAVLRGGVEIGTTTAAAFTDSALAVDGYAVYTVLAIDAAGNRSAASTSLTIRRDATPPVTPTGLATAAVTRTPPALAWAVAGDADGYRVYRSGALVGTVTAGAFTDASAPEGTWTYTVVAFDVAGNASAATAGAVATLDTTPPATPVATAGAELTNGAPTLAWSASPGVVAWEVQRDGVAIATVSTPGYADAGVLADATVAYRLVAVDAAGNRSAASAAVAITVDRVAPAAPTGLAGATPTRDAPSLRFRAVADAVRYAIYRDGVGIGTTTATSFTDAPAADGAYRYAVAAIDAAGNESARSVSRLIVLDTAAPSVPEGLGGLTPTNAVPAFTWTSVADAAHYVVRRDGVVVGEQATALDFEDVALEADLAARAAGAYVFAYTVVAVDEAGNASAPSAALAIAVDIGGSGAPRLLVAPSPTADRPHLTWQPVESASAYAVVRDGAVVATVADPAYTDDGLVDDGTFTYAVRALGAGGALLGTSSERVVDYDTTPPPTPARPEGASPTNDAPSLTWQRVAGATSYRLLRDGALVGSTASAGLVDDDLATDGAYQYAVVAVDAAGNASAPSPARRVILRTEPPSTPTGVAGASPTRAAPSLAWAASPTAAAYRVYRGSVLAGETTEAAFTDAAQPDGTIQYAVEAIDDVGNRSARSAGVAIVVDTTAPAVPTGTAAPQLARWDPAISWQGPGDAVAYRVLRDGEPIGTTATSPLVDAGAPDGAHVWRVVAIDLAGNESAPSAAATGAVDSTPPAAPVGLDAPAASAGPPELAWTPVADAAAYRIYRGAEAVGTAGAEAFVDEAVPGEGTFAYRVTALDAAGNESAQSAAVEVVVDTTAPAAPGALVAPSPTNGYPTLSWAAVPGATTYELLRDGDAVLAGPDPSAVDRALPADGTYAYAVVAIDAAGNRSEPSPTASVTVDTSQVGVPTNVVAIAAATAGAPRLAWAAIDPATLLRSATSLVYVIERDGAEVGRTTATTFDDEAVTADGTYAYTVSLSIDGGDPGTASSPATVTVDRSAPAVPAAPAAASPTRVAPSLAWSAVAGAARYVVVRDGARLATTTALALTDAAAADGSRAYAVIAVDAVGNESAASAAATVVVDTVPPAAPTGLAAARADTSAAPELAWAPVADAASYRVYRGATLIGQPTAATYVDAPLPADGGYAYRVAAVDAAGNEGARSAAVAVAVDTVAPEAPVPAAASRLTASAPVLTWPAIADAASYVLVKDGVELATVPATAGASATATDPAAAEGELAYAVRAVDRAGNRSAVSAAVAITVDRTAPAAPAAPLAARTVANAPAELAWTSVAGAVRYGVHRGGVRVATVAGATAWTEPSDLPDGTYVYALTAIDAAGNESPLSASAVVVLDTVAPARPTGVAPVASPTRLAPALAWGAVAGAATYRVARDGGLVGSTAGTTLADAGATADGGYAYTVVAVDLAGNASPATAPVTIVRDTLPPAAPSRLDAPALAAGAVEVSWPAVADADRYRILRDGQLIEERRTRTFTDATVGAEGARTYEVRAVDLAGNESTGATAVVTLDLTPPATPAAAAASSPTADAPRLTWTADPDVARYRVLRDGAALGLRDSGPFTDVADLADGTYAYALVAIDAAGNASPPSAATSVVLDRVAPPAPELRGPVDVQGAPALAWDGGGGAVAWELRRDGAVVATRTTRTFDDDAATAEGAYGYTAIAIDAAGNRSAASSPYVVTVDRTPPAAPGAPVAADEIARTSPALGWEAVAGATGYAILRDGVEVGTTAGTAFTDTLVATADVYAYALVALDAAGNRSAASPATSVDFRPGAPDAPAAPTGASPVSSLPTLQWTAVANVASYVVLRDGTAIGTTGSTLFADAGATADGTYSYAIAARAADGSESEPSPALAITVDGTPPAVLADLAADAARTRTAPGLAWSAVADAVAYRVTRDGVAVVRLDGAATGSALRWSDADAGEGAHLYGVRALDEAGNAGAPATVAVVVDRTPPGTPSPAAVAAVVQGVPAISWPAVEGAASYRVARDGGAVATVATTAFSDVERDADGLFAYRVAAVDDVGNASAPSAWVLVERDATPPAAAVGLRATSPTAGDVSLAWDAVPGAVRYRVLADGAALVEVAGTSHVATAAEGAHAYAVVAIDLAGNEGPASEPLAVVVDRTAPAAPAALTAAAAVTSGAPTLAWAPVADAVAYRVLRGGAAVATVAAPAYLDQASLADGTYAYAVAAIDAAGNVSASGASVTVRVDGTPPVRPASVVAVSPTRVAPVVRWLPVADAVAYRVERDGVLRATTSELAFTDDVPADGLYAYRVVALDEAVNASRPSDAVEVAVDTTAPAVPAAPAAETPTRSGPALAWDAIPGASSYAVLRDEVRIGETSDTSFVDVTLVDEGEHGYRLRALDAAGNASAAGPTTTVELDLTAPAAPVVAAASPTRSAPVLTWPAVEGATRYRVRRDGATVATITARRFEDDGVADGDHAYRVIALDAAGNASAPSDPAAVAVDRTAPAAPQPVALSPTRLDPVVTWPASAGAAVYEVVVDGGDPIGTADARIVLEGVAEGSHSVAVIAVDAAGNRSAASATLAIEVDRTAPAPLVAIVAVASPTTASPGLTWAASPGLRYAVDRDGAQIAVVEEGAFADVDVSQPGTYLYAVRALDAAGNAAAASPSVEIRYRPGAPATPAAPRAGSPSSLPVLTWDEVPNAAAYVVLRDGEELERVDGPPYVDAGSPAEGAHRYAVRAVAGNAAESDDGPELLVEVDRTPPETTLGSVETAIVDAATIPFSSDDPDAAFACRLDGGAWEPCSSPQALSDHAEGAHVVDVRAVDLAGNADATPATVALDADATPPAAPILTVVPDADVPLGSGAGAAHGEVSAGDAARVRVVRGDEVVLDGAPGAFTDAGLVDATPYVYEAVALDERGNASAPVAVAITTPDRTPPAAPSAIHGSGYPLVLSWNPDAGVTFTVSRDGVAFAVTAHAQLEDADAVDAVAPPAPVGLAIAGATDEAVTISWSASEDRGTAYAYGVGGTDEAGNAGPSSAVQSVEATSGTARYRVLVDGTQAAAVDTTSLELRGLDRRLRHRLMVLAVDAAGNVSPESAVLEVGDDLVPARPTGLEAESPTRRAPLLSWSAVDGAEVYTVLRDGEEVGTTAETTFADAQLDADGSYRYTVRAAGPAGLPSPPSEPLDVVRDTVAPDASIVSSPQEITGASATLELTSDDPAAQLLCGIDGSRPLVPCETPWLLSHLADGEHAVEVGAVDAAGNEDATPASAAFETDGTPPAAPTLDVVVDESLAKGSLRGRVAITAVPGDGAVRVVVTSGDRTILDGDGGTVADEVMDDEELTYTAVSYDAAGNVSDVTTRRVRTPDRTPPAPPILTADGSTLPVALAWSGEDGATARIARDGGDPIVTRERALVDRDAVDAAAPLAPGGVVVTPTAGGATVTWDGAADRGTAHSYVARLVDADGNTSRPSAPADVIATSGIATYRVLLDGALAQTVTARTATVGGLAPGSAHRIAIVAVDAAGNAAQATAERAFTLPASVGTAPPVIATASATPGAVRPGVAVALAADVRAGGAPLADVAWTFSGGGSATGASAQHAWGAEGAQTATLRAADTAGGSATRAVQVLVDGTQPTLALAQAGAVLTVTAGDPLAGLASVVATDGGRPLALGAGGTATLAEGSHAIVATATDRAGNVATASRTVVVDRTAPTILVDAPVAVPGATAVVTVKLVDAGGGAVRLALDGRPASAGRLTVPAGRRALLVATDAAGNARQLELTVQAVKPIAALTDRALDGPHKDELRFSGRQQAGARLALLQATALRLVALGRLPSTTVVGRTYAPTLKKAVVAFQRACRCKARSSALGTIDAGTKKALDAQLYALRRAGRAG